MGRKVNPKKWMSYDAMRMTIRELAPDVKARNQYWKWWDKHKPTGIPKYPNRVYLKDWKGWSDFFDNENHFGYKTIGRNFRGYWEAIKFVQSLNIKSVAEYRRLYRQGKIPNDIPLTPNNVYKNDWRGWKVFLGYDAQKRVETARVNTTAWAICNVAGYRDNYVQFIKDDKGPASLKATIQLSNLKCYKMFMWDKDKHDIVKNIMLSYGSPTDVERVWIVGNISALIFQLCGVLDDV